MMQWISAVVLILSCASGIEGEAKVDVKVCLDAHNTLRALHQDTPALEWDEELARKAQAYAEKLIENNRGSTRTSLVHEEPSNGMGENLYYSDRKDIKTCVDASNNWYNEINDYDYKTASSTNGWPVLHFTQMVWKNTQKVGFGVATMPSVKYAKYGNTLTIIVAKYSPQGNYVGEFSTNVLPLKSQI